MAFFAHRSAYCSLFASTHSRAFCRRPRKSAISARLGSMDAALAAMLDSPGISPVAVMIGRAPENTICCEMYGSHTGKASMLPRGSAAAASIGISLTNST
ncbi:hypothetical protein D9M70_574510 [compost metagenome]